MIRDELQQLLTTFIDGELTDEQFIELEKLLSQDPQAREKYHAQLQVFTLLSYGVVHPVQEVELDHDSAATFAEYVHKSSDKKSWEGDLQKEAGEKLGLNCENLGRIEQEHFHDLTISPLLTAINSATATMNYPLGMPLPASTNPLQPNPLNSDSLSPPSGIFNNFKSLFFLLAFATFIGILAAEGWIKYRKTEIASSPKKQEAEVISHSHPSTPIAFLTSAMGCDLVNTKSKKSWNVGDEVRLGDEITLREGIADFRLASSGVSLTIEGPASIVLTSSNSLILQQGKLTSKVPWKGVDFQLIAGGCRLTTQDAEFGVHAKGSNVSVHVFSGEVAVASSPFLPDDSKQNNEDPDSNSDPQSVPTIVSQGKAIEFSNNSGDNHVIREFTADQNQFASKISMSDRLQITSRYINAVKNSKPIGYWRFESVVGKEIKNEIPTGFPLKVTSELFLTGDSANRVLDLAQTTYEKDNLVSTEPMNELTKSNFSVEIWAKPSHYHRGYLVSATDKVTCRNGFIVQLQQEYGKNRPGTIYAGVNSQLGVTGIQTYSNELYALRRWQQIVVVNNKSALTLYMNGKIVGSTRGQAKMVRDLNLVVGRPFHDASDYPFVGQLDELSVYDRALSLQEITEHFKAVHDDEKPKPEL